MVKYARAASALSTRGRTARAIAFGASRSSTAPASPLRAAAKVARPSPTIGSSALAFGTSNSMRSSVPPPGVCANSTRARERIDHGQADSFPALLLAVRCATA